MDKLLEKKYSNRIRSDLAKKLKPYGFKRSKPTFYTRVKSDRIEFIHIHKFTSGPSFRVHIGARFFCDDFEAVALNGIDSDSFRKKYSLSYGRTEDSVLKCVEEMMEFILREGFAWFDYWMDPMRLLNENEKDSPIHRFKNEYFKFQAGEEDQGKVTLSKMLLGIKDETKKGTSDEKSTWKGNSER
ncbi:DUF4304 domain-containing protein [Paenibacillus sp. A14]|uniref:DUF4304 domain-containing protein n=1 Tax=Paenibacillus sp. A14 TaxID=3119820 RepID=UPI002FE25D56